MRKIIPSSSYSALMSTREFANDENFSCWNFVKCKAELLREGIIFLIHLFARAILLMKKLKIEETKAT